MKKTYKWRLVEENLAKDLKLYLNDLDYVYVDADKNGTSFKVWGALQAGRRKTFFITHVPVEDLANRVKVAIAIRKEGMVKSRRQLSSIYFWKNFENGDLLKDGLNKIFALVEWEEKERNDA